MNNKSANELAGNVSAALPAKSSITLTVNSVEKQLEVSPWTTLLDLLREYLDLTGTKKGCDHGQCGACTVLVNGKRIVQLGGEPNLSPEGLLTRSHSEYVEGKSLVDMIKEDLVAGRVAIDSYREMIGYLDNDDPTTRRMLESILAMEEEHADDLVSLLEELGS